MTKFPNAPQGIKSPCGYLTLQDVVDAKGIPLYQAKIWLKQMVEKGELVKDKQNRYWFSISVAR